MKANLLRKMMYYRGGKDDDSAVYKEEHNERLEALLSSLINPPEILARLPNFKVSPVHYGIALTTFVNMDRPDMVRCALPAML